MLQLWTDPVEINAKHTNPLKFNVQVIQHNFMMLGQHGELRAFFTMVMARL